MGTWGTGVFDDDDAQGFLGRTIDALAVAIKQDLAVLDERKKRSTYAGSRAIAGVACLGALTKSIDQAKYNLLRSQVESWRDSCLEWFDRDGASSWSSVEEAQQFRRNVVREFRLLINRLEEWDDWVE